MLTKRLNNGVLVLGKVYKGEICAKTFANRTQANIAAALYGGEVCRFNTFPFYVKVRDPQEDIAASA